MPGEPTALVKPQSRVSGTLTEHRPPPPKPKSEWPAGPPEPEPPAPDPHPFGTVVSHSVAGGGTVKPLCILWCLLASIAWGQGQVITAPQGGKQVTMFPFTAAGGTVGTVDVTQPPYSASNTGGTDATGAIQRAIDSGATTVFFPPGIYQACALIPRQPAQHWVGAGQGVSTIRGPAGCTNLILTSPPSPPQQGPAGLWVLEDLSLDGATTNLINLNGRDMDQAIINRVTFNTAGAPGDDGTIGLSSAGTMVSVTNSAFFSSRPPSGQAMNIVRGAHHSVIRDNVIKWLYNGIFIGATGTVGTSETVEGIILDSNIIDLGWWALPPKFTGIDDAGCVAAGVPLACCTGSGTGSCGTHITYAATTLTDSTANFSGLCDGTGGPGTCGAGLGNNVLVLTARDSTTRAVSFFKGGNISNATKNWVSAGVVPGDLAITTEKFCTGNGTLGPGARFVGVVGTDTCPTPGGDRCLCTTNSQCASGICEYRFATVTNANTSTTTDVIIDEWTSEGDGVGGAIQATRQPLGAPPDGAAVTIYGWVLGEVGSYTATVITLATKTGGWINRAGTTSTPAAGTYYRILGRHPNYPVQGLQSMRGSVITQNTISRGWSDALTLFGTDNIVTDNVVMDNQDHGINVQGARNTITGNRAGHCGARGIGILSADDNVLVGNVAFDSPWVNNLNTTSLGDITVQGNRNLLSGNKVQQTIPVASNRYGFIVTGSSDLNILDAATCQGTYSTGCIRIDGASATNVRILNYHGETISNTSGTFSIEGGRTTQALGTANAAANGSFFGCTDCTVANPCAGAGTGAVAKRQGGAWVCN